MPDWAEHVRQRLSPLRISPPRESEIVEELSQHLDDRWREFIAGGASPDEATRLALADFRDGNVLAQYMAPLRQAHATPSITPGASSGDLLSDLWQDLRYASRFLRKQPGFAAAAILTLALGIGANGAIFALVDATLLRPLPFPHPERLVMVSERTETAEHDRVAPLNLIDWDNQNRTFDGMAGFIPGVGGMVMSNPDGTPETVPRQWVTAGIFQTLGIRAITGRTFLPSDDRQRSKVVVLSEAFWRARFNADPRVVGRDITLDGSPYTVVGVVPKEAQLVGRTSIWVLIPIQGAPAGARSVHAFHVIGRLKPSVDLKAANADMAAVTEALALEFPKTNKGRGVTIEPLHDAVIGGDLRQTSMLFLGVVGFVLLICCANIANLLLTRATGRRRELVMRSALGASRSRMIRQLLTESIVLSIIGGALGLAVGAGILSFALTLIPERFLPGAVTLAFDLRVAVFCAATALLAGVLFGLIPAWQATEFSSASVIGAESRTVTGRGGQIRWLLVVAEVATAVILLYGGGLLLRTLLAVDNIDPGYRARSILSMVVDPLDSRYPTAAAVLRFYKAVDDEVRAVPGILDVAWASTLPLGPSYAGRSFFEIVGAPPVDETRRPTADYQIVSPTYFRTLDLPVLSGRSFNDRDTLDNVPVCLVNEAFVRTQLHGRSPIGLKVAIWPTESAQAPRVVREIVGVVRQVKGRPDETEDFVQIYVPMAQDPIGDMFLAVRAKSGRSEALAHSVRAAIARVDKENLVSVRSVTTLEDVAWEATERQRFRAVLVMAFAGLALLLAMIGLSGILAYTVQQQMRDFGVRRALGATTADVLRLVGGSAVRMIATGTAIGLALSAVLARLVAAVLFAVKPLDPITLASVSVVLALTAGVSTAAPAWRAARIDPAVALRTE